MIYVLKSVNNRFSIPFTKLEKTSKHKNKERIKFWSYEQNTVLYAKQLYFWREERIEKQVFWTLIKKFENHFLMISLSIFEKMFLKIPVLSSPQVKIHFVSKSFFLGVKKICFTLTHTRAWRWGVNFTNILREAFFVWKFCTKLFVITF